MTLEHTLALTCSYLDLGDARARQILAMFTARSAAQSGPATSVQQQRECSGAHFEHALLKHRKLMQVILPAESSKWCCQCLSGILVYAAAPLVSTMQAVHAFRSFVAGQLRIRRRLQGSQQLQR
jgi:hypothetical protein